MEFIRSLVKGVLLFSVAVASFPMLAVAEDVRFPTAVLPGITEPASLSATIYKPDGAGPFPAIIVLHDCGGLDDHPRKWAMRLMTWGYVAIVPGSFGSRGYGNLCTRVETVGTTARVQDTIGAAEYLATMPYVQKNNIGVLGFSHGGWTIMKGVQEHAYWSMYGIRGAVAYYPYCTAPQDNNVVLPLRILIGEKDDWTLAQRCRDVISGARKPSLIEATFYPDTYHSFDRGGKTTFVNGQGGGKTTARRIEGNPAATRDAEAQTRAFFDRLLLGR